MKKKLTFSSLFLLLSLYTSQYIGLAFFAEAFIAILRQNGMPLKNLGLIYFLGLFWVIRFLWAPLIDKVHFYKFGHYKIWIILFQFFMALALLSISLTNIKTHLHIIILLSVIFAFFASLQSVALDGFVYNNVFKRQRATAMSIKMASGLIGMILGGGIGLILYSHFGWKISIIILTLPMFAALFQIAFFKERKTKVIKTRIRYNELILFWRGKKKWLAFLLLYPVSISTAYGFLTPILVDLHWSLAQIGFIVHILGYSIGVLASFTTPWLIKHYGKRKILIFAALGQAIGVLLLLLLFQSISAFNVICIVGFVFSFYTPSSVIISTIMMDRTFSNSPASSFSIQQSVYMFSGIASSAISLSLAGVFGYQSIIIACALLGLFTTYFSSTMDTFLSLKGKQSDRSALISTCS